MTLPPTCQNRSFVDGTTVCRWGDYAAATLDPTIDGVIWGTNMWISADECYRTKNFALQPVAAP